MDEVLIFLNDAEIDIFEITDLANTMQIDLENLQPKLERLVKRGLLSRIEKGKYCRHNFRNEYVIANYLAPAGAIAYWSALNLHGLTTQFSNTIFVQTPQLKRNKEVFGVSYQFVKVKSSKATCYELSGLGNHTFRLTNLEKTLIDCFDLPEYSGGFAELIFALNKSTLNSKKLIEAAKSVDNLSVIKRLGYLIELLQKENLGSFINFAQRSLNQKFTLFDPQGTDSGDFNAKWKLRLNVKETDILAMSANHY